MTIKYTCRYAQTGQERSAFASRGVRRDDLLGFVVVDAKVSLIVFDLFCTYIIVLLQFAFMWSRIDRENKPFNAHS